MRDFIYILTQTIGIGDEIRLNVEIDQVVSLIGNKNLTLLLGAIEVPVSLESENGGKNFVFKGVIPEGLSSGEYGITVKAMSDLDIVNVNAKLMNLSQNIVTKGTVNVIAPVEVAPLAPVVTVGNITETGAILTWETPSDSPEEIAKYIVSDGVSEKEVLVSSSEARIGTVTITDNGNLPESESGNDSINANGTEVVTESYSYNITGLQSEREYTYTVRAVGKNGLESEPSAITFKTLENTNGINGLTSSAVNGTINRFDTVKFKLNLGSDVSKVKVIYYWNENGIKNTYEEYYTVGTPGSLTVDRKLRFARNYQVEFIPMVNGKLQNDEAKRVDLNVVENKVGDIFGAITGNGDTGSTNIQKVGDSVQFTIETALNVDRIQFKFVTSNNYIEYYNKATNAQVVGDKLVWTIDRPIRTLRDPHKLVISAMNEGYVMASSNFEITIGR